MALANWIWLALAASGAALLAVKFPTLFVAFKWIGLGVIVWLGVSQMRAPVDAFARRLDAAPPRGKLLASGIALQLSNPMALITFAGLIPSFFDASRAILPQYFLMVGTITVLELFGLGVYAGFGTLVRKQLEDASKARLFNFATGGLLIGAGIVAVFSTL